MTWESTSVWFLLGLAIIPLLAWRIFSSRRTSAIRFSSTKQMQGLRKTWKIRLQWIPRVLRLLAIAVIIIAIARPRESNEETKIHAEGVAIQMLVDRSGSMRAMDFKIEGQPVDRLTAVKDVAGKFVLGDKSDESELTGRHSDMIGLITFARYADNASPLTLDHTYLSDRLNKTEIVTERSEDGTAIGDAIGLAVDRVRAMEQSRSSKPISDENENETENETKKVKSKVVILLTDGENNSGDITPVQAAELAATMDVKIYTIGVGTRGTAPVPVINPFTGRTQMQMMQVNIDEDTLKKIAKITGGEYFRATDTDSLTKIYSEIDRLEKTKLDEKRYVDYRELAIKSGQVPIYRSGNSAWMLPTLPPLLLIAFILIAMECILSGTYFRRIP